jgi:hypothetical protein
MNQGVIQNFLNLPGLAGVALMDGMSRPCFYGFHAELETSQQQAVAQNIQQVLETAPEGFTSFEFQFDFYRVYLHKLNQQVTLLVLTNDQLSRSTYLPTVRHLLLELQLSRTNLMSEFRDILTQIVVPCSNPPASATAPIKTANSPPPAPPALPGPLPSPPLAIAVSPPAPQTVLSQAVSVKEILAAMNALSQFTTQYLGTLVVANYWESTRPPDDWLLHFQIERSAQMTFIVQVPSERLPLLSEEQYQSIKRWVAAFVERCSKIIRNFANLLQHKLDHRHQILLFDLPN